MDTLYSNGTRVLDDNKNSSTNDLTEKRLEEGAFDGCETNVDERGMSL